MDFNAGFGMGVVKWFFQDRGTMDQDTKTILTTQCQHAMDGSPDA